MKLPRVGEVLEFLGGLAILFIVYLLPTLLWLGFLGLCVAALIKYVF